MNEQLVKLAARFLGLGRGPSPIIWLAFLHVGSYRFCQGEAGV